MKRSEACPGMFLLVLTLVLVILLAGTLHAFSPVRAAILPAAFPKLAPTAGSSSIPVPTQMPAQVPPPIELSADMTGVIALAILVVAVTLIGMVWGAASNRRKKPSKK